MKDKLTHEVEILGRSVSVLLLAGLIMAAGASAALLDSFGTVDGEAEVTQSIVVDGDSTGEYSNTDDSVSVTAGDYQVADLSDEDRNYFTLESNLADSFTVGYSHQYTDEGYDENAGYFDQVQGIVTHEFVYEKREWDDSEYDAYVRADSADVGENDYEYEPSELETAIKENEAVLVESRDSAYEISGQVNTGALTLESTEGPTATTVDFDEGQLEANGDDVEIRGFKLTGEEPSDSLEGIVFHTTGDGDLSGSLIFEHNIVDADRTTENTNSEEEHYRYLWSQDTEILEVRGNFFYGGDAHAAIEVNLDDEGSGSVYVDSNTFTDVPADQKAIALRTKEGSTGDQEVTENNFANVGHSIEQQNDADLTDVSGNYFAVESDKDLLDFGSAEAPDFSEEASEPVSTSEIEVPADEEGQLNIGQVHYFDIALPGSSNDYGFQTQIEPIR